MSSTPAPHRDCVAPSGSEAIVDAAIGAAALAGALALALALGTLDLLSAGLVTVSAAPVVLWRRAPSGVFALTACASIVLAALGYPVGLPVGATVALHLLAANRDGKRPWTARTTLSVLTLLFAYLAAIALATTTVPTTERARLRHERVAELNERAAQAARETERERLLAVAEERARIARDLHDSAGHAINVIAVRAGAARLRHAQEPERSLAALEAIEDLARRTVEEIDHLVGKLRNGGRDDDPEGAGVEAPPGLASLDTLVAQHAASGLDVTVGTAGTPRPLGRGADQAAFRILQESLTNAARHGVGTARVELGFGDDGLQVTVTNPVPSGGSTRGDGGHGLVGMRERATLLGGTIAAGRSAGSFRVRAMLPYGPRSA